jgi:RimJ/RimL family protein N-acetyltransferase
MHFVPLSPALADAIAPWFDDVTTQAYLGGRDWLYDELRLTVATPGTVFRGQRVLSRHAWVAQDESLGPIGIAIVEPYDDGTAGVALAIAPDRRGAGDGRRVLLLLEAQPELADVRALIGGVEPGNVPAQRVCRAAGYSVAATIDDEGMLAVRKNLGRGAGAGERP